MALHNCALFWNKNINLLRSKKKHKEDFLLRGVVALLRDVFSKAQEVCSGGQILYWAGQEERKQSSSRVTLRSMVVRALGHTFLAFG